MRLGFAVKVLGRGGLPSHDTRRWRSAPHLEVSLRHLGIIFDYLEDTGIRMYRMASSLAPYASHPDLPQFRSQVEECVGGLERLGRRATTMGLRLSMHPGQYTVLNSENAEVVKAAIAELDVHAEILDGMGLGPEAVVVLHVGGRSGGLDAAFDRFEHGFSLLPERAQRRLVIENDDRAFSLTDVLALSKRIGRPVVWDVLHHYCHDPDRVPDVEALRLAMATWPDGVRPKVHFSSPRADAPQRTSTKQRRAITTVDLPPMRAHADLIDPIAFAGFVAAVPLGTRAFDVMLEAKAKDLALLRLRDQMKARGLLVG